LYLVEQNRKPQEAPAEEEQLPSLPPSKPTSRASSVQDNEEYESASEDRPVTAKPVLAPLKTGNFHEDHRLDNVLGSGHSTPKASQFPSEVQGSVTRAQPEFYSWEDMLREENLRNIAAAAAQAKDDADPAGAEPVNPGEAQTEDVVETASWPKSKADPISRTSDTGKDSGEEQDVTLSDVFEDDRSRSRDAADVEAPDDGFPADQAYPSGPQADNQPVSEPEPARSFLERRASKKAKKGKKGRALELGTTIVTSDQPEVVEVEEVARRQQQDTEDALDLWVQASTSPEMPSSEKGKDISEAANEPGTQPVNLATEADIATRVVDPAEDTLRPEEASQPSDTQEPDSVELFPAHATPLEDIGPHDEGLVDDDPVTQGEPVSAGPASSTRDVPTTSSVVAAVDQVATPQEEPWDEFPSTFKKSKGKKNKKKAFVAWDEPVTDPVDITPRPNVVSREVDVFQEGTDSQDLAPQKDAAPADVALPENTRTEPAASSKKSKNKKGKKKAVDIREEPTAELAVPTHQGLVSQEDSPRDTAPQEESWTTPTTSKKSKGKKGKKKAFVLWDEPQAETTSAGPDDLAPESPHESQHLQTSRDVDVDERGDDVASTEPELDKPTSTAQAGQSEANVEEVERFVPEPEVTHESQATREQGSSDAVIHPDDVNFPQSNVQPQVSAERDEAVEHTEEEASHPHPRTEIEKLTELSPSGMIGAATYQTDLDPELEQPTPVQEKMSHMPGAFDFDGDYSRSFGARELGPAEQHEPFNGYLVESTFPEVKDQSMHELEERVAQPSDTETDKQAFTDHHDLLDRSVTPQASDQPNRDIERSENTEVEPDDKGETSAAENEASDCVVKAADNNEPIGQSAHVSDANDQDAAPEVEVEQEAPVADAEPFAFTVKQSKKDKKKAKKLKQKELSADAAAEDFEPLAQDPATSRQAQLDEEQAVSEPVVWQQDASYAPSDARDDTQELQREQGTDSSNNPTTTEHISQDDIAISVENSAIKPKLSKKDKKKAKKNQIWSDDWEPAPIEPAVQSSAEQADQDQLERKEPKEHEWAEMPKKISKKEKRKAKKAAQFEAGEDDPEITNDASLPENTVPEEIDPDHVPMPGSFNAHAINNDENEVPSQEDRDDQDPIFEPQTDRNKSSENRDPSPVPAFAESGAIEGAQPQPQNEVSDSILLDRVMEAPVDNSTQVDNGTEQERTPVDGLPSDQAESRHRGRSPTLPREVRRPEQVEERQQPSSQYSRNVPASFGAEHIPLDENAREQATFDSSPDASHYYNDSPEVDVPRAAEETPHVLEGHEDGQAGLEHTMSYPSEDTIQDVQADPATIPDRHTLHHHLHRSGSRNLGLLPGDLPSSRHPSRAASPAPSHGSSHGTVQYDPRRSGSRNLGLLHGDLTPSRHSSRAASPISSGQAPHDVDFAATLAAGLGETGFDPNIVVKDPSFHRRASPQGMDDSNLEDEFVPFVTKGKKKKDRKQDNIEAVPDVAEEGASDQPTMDLMGDPAARRATRSANKEHNNTEGSKDDGFDAALAASLGIAGFSAADMLARSATVSDELDDFTFTAPKNKKKRKGKGNKISEIEEPVNEGGRADTADKEPDGSLASKEVLGPAEQSREMPPAEAEAVDENKESADMSKGTVTAEDVLPNKKGKKAKGKKPSSQALREPSPIRETGEVKDARIEPEFRVMTRKKAKKNKKGKAFDWTVDNNEAEQPLPPQEAAPDNNPQLDLAEPSDIAQTIPAQRSEMADSGSAQPAMANSQEEPTWSFDNVSDGAPQVEEPPNELPAEAPRDNTRDSGYDTVRNSLGTTTQDEVEPQDRELAADSFNDWTLPVQKGRFKGKQSMRGVEDHDHGQDNLEPAQDAPKSPEPTTKNRASYLFNTPPTVERAQPRSTLSSDKKMQGDYFGGRNHKSTPTPTPDELQSPQQSPDEIRSPYTSLVLPVRKGSNAENDIGLSSRDLKSARRSATPTRSSRGRMNADDGTSLPAANISSHTYGSTSPTPSTRGLRLASIPIDENRELSSIDDRLRKSDIGKRFASDMRSPSAQSYASSGTGRSLRSPDQLQSMSAASNRSLKRTDRSMSGDLRAAARRGEPLIPPPSQTSTSTLNINTPPSFVNTNIQPLAFQAPLTPPLNEADAAAARMANVYEGWGDGERTTVSPTRPPSARKRQSMHLMDMEAKVNQLTEENRRLQQAHEDAGRSADGDISTEAYSKLREALENTETELQEKDVQITQIRALLDPLQQEVNRLTEINENLGEANHNLIADTNDRYATLQSEHAHAHDQWQQSSRELEDLREKHAELSSGMEDVVRQHIDQALEDKNAEIQSLRAELETATSQIRALQSQIQHSSSSPDYLPTKSEDYFDSACQKLCQAIQQWILRFSKSSDNRACRLSDELDNDKLEARLDNIMLDGSDVDKLLVDRVRRRDVFMALTMAMVWEYVFTRYLFGMDREQRAKLKALEKTLLDVGPARAVAHWRATTLTLLSQRPQFAAQRALDTEAVTHEIYATLAALLPPPAALETQLLAGLQRVLASAVQLAVEFRCQRPEYLMLPPPVPEYDSAGDLVRKTRFEVGTMNERSGEWSDNEELVRRGAVVKMVLFPLVVRKGDELGEGGEETVICPAQVLVAGERGGKRVRMDLDVSSLGTGIGGRSGLSVGSMGTF